MNKFFIASLALIAIIITGCTNSYERCKEQCKDAYGRPGNGYLSGGGLEIQKCIEDKCVGQ